MTKKIMSFVLAAVLLAAIRPALAEAKPDVPAERICEALLSSMEPQYYPACECFAAGYEALGYTQTGDVLEVYLAASVGGYGFFNDAFVSLSGWGGPCTAVFWHRGGEWTFHELKEVESWNEIPYIMPASAIEKWRAMTDNSGIEEQKRRQVQAYLDSIGRTEPIMELSDMDMASSGMLVMASNFRMAVDAAYPSWCTTAERLDQKDGQRYLYNRSWQPDPDGVMDPTYPTQSGTMQERGTTGTETLTKARKSDGAVLEKTVIKVELEQLTITMADASGSATYVFPYDQQQITYLQPTVTRQGTCRMDTRRLDRDMDELPGHREPQPVVEAQAVVRPDEQFTVLKDGSRNTLVYSRRRGGAWQEVWRNDKLLPRTNQLIYLSPAPTDAPSLHETTRRQVMRLSGLSIYAGEEQPNLAISLYVNDQDVWQVDSYSWDGEWLYAVLEDDGMFINDGDLSAWSVGSFHFMPVNRDAAAFDKDIIFTTRETVNEETGGAPRLGAAFAHADEMYINLKKDVRLPVYATPDFNGPRAAKGKAAVSLNDWVVVLAKMDNAMCILYEVTPGQYRMGWVDATKDRQLQRLLDITIPAQFMEDTYRQASRGTPLLDDPIHLSGTLLTLKKGARLRVLWEGQYAHYVEVTRNGQTWWGFVAAQDVQ